MFRLILAICIMLSMFSSVEAKDVRIGTLGITNLFTVDGKSGGYAYDYLADIQAYVDWQYEFMPTYFPDQLERLRNDEVDIVPLVIGTPENRAEFLFPDIPMAHYLTLLCTLPDENGNTNLKTSEPRVGVIDRYINFEAFNGYCAEHGIRPTLVYFPNKRELHRAMQAGEIDAAAINSFCYDSRETTIAVISYDPVFFAINPKRPDLLQDMNYAQRQIHAISMGYEDKLFQAYYEGTITYNISLTDEERNFIKEKKKLKAAVIDNFAPFMYWDILDNPQGIAVETLTAIGMQFNIPIEFVKVTKVNEAYAMLIAGDVDLVASHFGMIDSHDTLNVVTSKTFFQSIQSQVTEKNFDLSTASNVKYATDKLTKNLGNLPPNTMIFDTPEEAVEAVYDGRVQVALGAFYLHQNILSRAKFRNLSCTPSKVIGKGVSFLISRDADPAIRSIINKGIISRSDSDVLQIVSKSATTHKSESFGEKLFYENPEETIIGLLIALSLISATIYFQIRRRMLAHQLAEKEVYESKLQVALDQAQRASKAKSDFLARMTHEIRTPINAILGFNKMIEENPHNESNFQTWHRKIDVSGKHLLQLVNDVLDISKLNSGQIQLEPKEVSMADMMEQIDIVYTELAHEKQIDLKFEHPSDNYIFIADEIRLKQILINLLSNALKYNKCGGNVVMNIERLDSADDKLRVRFSIRDNGIGIDPENLKTIFNEFERTKHSKDLWIEGAGLGLAISSKLARLMNSEIHVESEVGVGSHFWIEFEFPLIKVEPFEEVSDDSAPPNCEGRHVLVAEDNELNAELITFILEEMNAQVDLAENGKIACEKFEASPEGFYSFVIMDIMMPVMSGYEATREIRRLPRHDAESIPIIALSANSFDEDRAKSKEAGMSNHCAKPIDPGEFYSAIRKAIAA